MKMSGKKKFDYELESLTKKNLKEFKKLHIVVLPVKFPFGVYNKLVTNENNRKYSFLIRKKTPKVKNKESSVDEKEEKKKESQVEYVGAIGCELDDKKCSLTILMFSILAGYRGKGIGSSVLGDILCMTRKNEPFLESMRLHVHTGNKKGIRFYKRLGFVILKKIQNYYRKLKPRSCFLMKKDLQIIRKKEEQK